MRTILHADLDAFFCAVEELLDPSLAGKAFIVGGSAQGRGVVASASYAARRFGIHSAMPTARALRLAPGLIIRRSRHHIYREYSERVMGLLRDAAPVVEQISIDEAFIDVSGDERPGGEIAAALQQDIQERLGLPTSWGVASNKLVAKIATEVGKPKGLIIVPPGEEARFLAPLPVGMLWGVGPKTRARLEAQGVQTIGALAALPPESLRALFGEHGLELASRARGLDDRPLVEAREPKSMSAERTFAADVRSRKEIERTLLRLSEQVGRRLRKAGLAGTTVRLKLRWPDFETLTRQRQVRQPTDRDGEIYAAAKELLDKVWTRKRAIRLIGVGVSELQAPVRQLSLFDRSWERDERLYAAIDAIRARFGPDAMRRAGSLRRDGSRDASRRERSGGGGQDEQGGSSA